MALRELAMRNTRNMDFFSIWLEPLEALGAHNVADVNYLLHGDLIMIGMTVVDIRKLHAIIWTRNQAQPLADDCADPQAQPLAGREFAHGLLPPADEELALLQDAMTKIERQAIQSLDMCSADESVDVTSCAATAHDQLSELPRTTGLAINAENALIRALSLGPTSKSRKALEEAGKCIRDSIVLRVQVGVPIACRDSFIQALEEAYGGAIPEDAFAKLMHSHSKVVSPLFEYAFKSPGAVNNVVRRKRKRLRDLRRRATLKADLADLESGIAVSPAAPDTVPAFGEQEMPIKIYQI